MSSLSSETLVALNKVAGESGRLLKPEILESAFASVDYYDDLYEKIASVVRSVMQGHPFVDGNKRTGILFLFSATAAAGLHVPPKSDDEVVDFATQSVTQRWSVKQIANWIRN